ncbi:MAG: hypothetical protein GY898_25700 [Proteobacteria bacterium]|nr:hypothetical protein [Pseudomonadota bacterium]
MNILGIHEGHDTAAALVRDGRLVAAVEEGRLRRLKGFDARRNLGGMPHRAVEAVLERGGIGPADVDVIALPLAPLHEDWARGARQIHPGTTGLAARLGSAGVKAARLARLRRFCRLRGLRGRRFFVHHHVAHAASATMTAGWESGAVLTLDGKGDLLSGLIGRFGPAGFELFEEIDQRDSVAILYSAVTQMLGFRADRDEGKVTALAAEGQADPQVRAVLDGLLAWREGPWNRGIRSRGGPSTLVWQPTNALTSVLREALDTRGRADVAFEMQRLLERVVLQLVQRVLELAGSGRLAAAGGVFANVTLNRTIEALDSVEALWVHPAMGDSGLAAGAALHATSVLQGTASHRPRDVFLGPDVPDGEAIAALRARGLPVRSVQGPGEIAALLAQGKAVAVCRGPLEHGPRALGGRSILLRPDDLDAPRWLNRALGRDEVMPFAPAVAASAAARCLHDVPLGSANGPFMTTSFRATEWMRSNCGAVVHTDGTTRAQIVDPERHPWFGELLAAFEDRTGLPCLLNTSFNRHGEAIVASAANAVETWAAAGLDALLVGGFLVTREDLGR